MMLQIQQFTFSPFQENTFVVYSASKNCWIIDPGCYFPEEKATLERFLKENELVPTRLLLTHCHLDHIFGCAFIENRFGLKPEYHAKDEPTLKLAPMSAKLYGIDGFEPVPEATNHIRENEVLELDGNEFEVRFCPGHAPGHVVFVNHAQQFVIGGDVLFRESIGRTDLPGGNHTQLINSINTQLFTLPDTYTVYCGHGSETNIGHEKRNNPFLVD